MWRWRLERWVAALRTSCDFSCSHALSYSCSVTFSISDADWHCGLAHAWD
jgi:hypothetical protein